MSCPVCGRQGVRVEVSGPGGSYGYVSCCEAPLEVVDQWDDWADVPEAKRLAALQRGREKIAAMREAMREAGRRFRQRRDEYARLGGSVLVESGDTRPE